MIKLATDQHDFIKKFSWPDNRKTYTTSIKTVHGKKITNQRNDFQHKLSTKLTKERAIIAIENLDVKELLQKKERNIC